MNYTSSISMPELQEQDITDARTHSRRSSSESNLTLTSVYSDYMENDIRHDSTAIFTKHVPFTSIISSSEPSRDLWADARDLILENRTLKHRQLGFIKEPANTTCRQTRLLDLIDAIENCEKNMDDVAATLGMKRDAMMQDTRAWESGGSVKPARFCVWMIGFLGVCLWPLALLPLQMWGLKDGKFMNSF